jgi:hypothetical protein
VSALDGKKIMEHLSEEVLTRCAFAETTLTDEEAAHLATCPDCQARLAALRDIASELTVARHSEPPSAVRARAHQFFAQIQQQPSWLERIVQRFQAQLLWDSRQQLATQGLRQGVSERYHLLYTTERVEVELSVQPQADGLRLEGDLLPTGPGDPFSQALIHLQPADPIAIPYEFHSADDGHFRVTAVVPGRYTLLITPQNGPLVEIEGLALT